MNISIPGTVLQMSREDAAAIDDRFRAMFLTGGIVLSQVSSITGLEPYTVQNWVKRGFLAPPVRKRYTLRQLCRIININMLKAALPVDDICGLLAYINGQLDDESDDLIDDSQLYFLFVKMVVCRETAERFDEEAYLDQALAQYRETVPGARERVREVLLVMLTAWMAAQLRLRAEQMVEQMKNKEDVA